MGFLQCRRNFSLAVAKSINRCQFETGFSLRGEVWVAFWNYSISTQGEKKSDKRKISHCHIFGHPCSCFPSPPFSLCKLCVIIFNLMYNKHVYCRISFVMSKYSVLSVLFNQNRQTDKITLVNGFSGCPAVISFCILYVDMHSYKDPVALS